MSNRLLLVLGGVVFPLMVLGAGCSRPATHGSGQSQTSLQVPKPPAIKDMSPHDAARAINFIGGNVIELHQHIRGTASAFAVQHGVGANGGTEEVVIKSFGPPYTASFDWKLSTEVTVKGKQEEKQYVGSIMDANLQNAYELYPPAYWNEGVQSALGTGGLWLSRDVYENLEKTRISTMKYGFEDPQLLTFRSKDFMDPALQLKAHVDKILPHTDVYLTQAETNFGSYTLLVNGATTTVETINAHNWFGDMVVLNNPENPLVLKMTTGDLPVPELNGLFDYEVTKLDSFTN